MKVNVLFVCLGNICRSPAAEGVFLHLIKERKLEKFFHVDSAGTSGFHAGEKADSRMRLAATARNIVLPSLSRQLIREDFEKFDYIIVMDDSNYENSLRLTSKPDHKEKVIKLTNYLKKLNFDEVPDPYYGGAKGFDLVLDIVTEACENLLQEIQTKYEF